QGSDGGPQLVSIEALQKTFGSAGSSVKLVVLNACYGDEQADALLAHVDCIVGMNGLIRDDAARSFAIGFYGGLGEQQSIAASYKQGCAAISLEGVPDRAKPHLKIRRDVSAEDFLLAVPNQDANLTPATRYITPPTQELARSKSWPRRHYL